MGDFQTPIDAHLSTFGPEFFRGAMWGAGLSGALSFACGIKFYRRLVARHTEVIRAKTGASAAATAQVLKAGAMGVHHGSRQLAVPSYWQVDAYSFLGTFLFFLTSFLKGLKCLIARTRYMEFLWEEFDFLSEASDAEISAVAAAVQRTDDDARRALARANQPGSSAASSNYKVADDAGEDPFAEYVAPTFWDGFALGIWGSVHDTFYPSKPARSYLYFQAGMGSV